MNPVITEWSETCTTAAEGCLSLPGTSVEVSRPDEVAVVALDLQGVHLEMRLSGFPARIVQHEIDHLDGCLILDRATPEERRRVMKERRERTHSGGHMSFAFAGTPRFASWVLRELVELGRVPALVISQPDRPRGRGQAGSGPHARSQRPPVWAWSACRPTT